MSGDMLDVAVITSPVGVSTVIVTVLDSDGRPSLPAQFDLYAAQDLASLLDRAIETLKLRETAAGRSWSAYRGSRSFGVSLGTVYAADRAAALDRARQQWPNVQRLFVVRDAFAREASHA